MVLTHSTLSENFNSILQNIQKYHISYPVRFYFHIDFSSIFKTSPATIFALIFIENGSRTRRGRPNGPPFLVPFSRSLPHVDFCIQSGHPLAPFGLPFPPPGYLFTPPLPMPCPVRPSWGILFPPLANLFTPPWPIPLNTHSHVRSYMKISFIGG